MDKRYGNMELVKIDVKIPRGVYNQIKNQVEVEGSSITDIFVELYQSSRLASLDYDLFGDGLEKDFIERLMNRAIDLRKSSDLHFKLFIDKIENIILLDNSSPILNKSSETEELIRSLYCDFGAVDKRRLLNLFLYSESNFNALLKKFLILLET